MSELDVTYITCSSYSGSTLLSFLLNDHPDITTVGHMTGWPMKFWSETDGKGFRCSCGELLIECPFFVRMGEVFDAAGLPHAPGDFGTNFRVTENDRMNRYLLQALPKIRIPWLEDLRDRVVDAVPVFHARLEQQKRANVTFIETALELAGAKVFLDNSHRPYRLRTLANLPQLDLSVIHLVRDFRGVVNSTMQRRNWPAKLTTHAWLNEQVDSHRIASKFSRFRVLYYEDLCNDLDGTLSDLHRFSGLEPHPFSGDLGTREHHILGNMMRLKLGKVTKDTRWRTELSASDLAEITRTAESFIRKNPDSAVSSIVARYIEEDPGA